MHFHCHMWYPNHYLYLEKCSYPSRYQENRSIKENIVCTGFSNFSGLRRDVIKKDLWRESTWWLISFFGDSMQNFDKQWINWGPKFMNWNISQHLVWGAKI